ncbi:hypothetical protein PTSG_03400 [Salpingoeca rosetta]|uniref:Uncharacterized protein n=1 Tax=Salpingoeca rosetta (strain ATCC 50818 / BSB-021) TaxID=946362 RepID=F2U533_SALR5|nr:uncharacterized protein PTSG_03400 [Salpingoeca rosetta]EGD82749.1 hypothetical protein PTSG_03400 [Salpingoeca rosetta]|eukprot:XP_004995985.1 hypothetical protein PTSG_03400 [Salpingoeca rosetta]
MVGMVKGPTPPTTPSSRASSARVSTKSRLKRRLTQKRLERREQTRQQKEEDRAQLQEELDRVRQVPLDVLAAEWLNETITDARTRMYLVETCLGSVVLAMEKLLREAERRELLEAPKMTASFNPINYLAQALMRNNPRFSNFADASPYMRSMRRVELELRDRVYDITEDQQAKRQAELQRRKQLMEEKQQQAIARMQEVIDTAAPHFAEHPKSLVYSVLRAHDTAHVQFPQLFAEDRPVDESGDVSRQNLAVLLAPLVADMPQDDTIRLLKELDAACSQNTSPSPGTTATTTFAGHGGTEDADSAYAALTAEFPSTLSLFAENTAALRHPHGGDAEALMGGGVATDDEAEAADAKRGQEEEVEGEKEVKEEENEEGEGMRDNKADEEAEAGADDTQQNAANGDDDDDGDDDTARPGTAEAHGQEAADTDGDGKTRGDGDASRADSKQQDEQQSAEHAGEGTTTDGANTSDGDAEAATSNEHGDDDDGGGGGDGGETVEHAESGGQGDDDTSTSEAPQPEQS